VTDFYIYAIALVAVSMFFVLLPLLGKAKQAELQLTNANVVKQRMTELEQEVEEGLISEKDKETAIRELKLALVEESDRVSASSNIEPVRVVNWPLVSLLSLPAIAIGIWVYFTANQLDGLSEYTSVQSQKEEITQLILGQSDREVTPDDYAKLALIIRNRLRSAPDDAEGWRSLGRVQMTIGRMEESISAYEKALKIAPANLDIREQYAQALMAAGTEESLENARRQVEYMIGLEPENREYRLLLTVIATQLGEVDLAVENFLMIRSMLSESSNFYQSLVAQMINIGAPESLLLGEGQNLRAASADGASDMSGVVANTGDAGTGINITVEIAPSLVSKLPDSGYLIVFAQNADVESRVPLAVVRMPLQSFPVALNLSESDAMLPSMSLTTASNVRLTARVSMDEDVMPSTGELQGEINVLELSQGEQVSAVIQINKEI
jgi:cytochrome c-type biogenesis protein CcmI